MAVSIIYLVACILIHRRTRSGRLAQPSNAQKMPESLYLEEIEPIVDVLFNLSLDPVR